MRLFTFYLRRCLLWWIQFCFRDPCLSMWMVEKLVWETWEILYVTLWFWKSLEQSKFHIVDMIFFLKLYNKNYTVIMFDSSINFCYYFEQRKIWYVLSYLNRCYWIYYRYIVFVLCPVHWYRIFCLFGQCFMNSVLQCLSNTKPLVEYFLRDDFTFDKNTTTSSMKGQLVTGMFRNHLPPVSLKIGEIHVLEIIIKDKKIIF